MPAQPPFASKKRRANSTRWLKPVADKDENLCAPNRELSAQNRELTPRIIVEKPARLIASSKMR
jgi:hypothetical protein